MQINGQGELGVQNVGVSVISDNPVEDIFAFTAYTRPGEAAVTESGKTIGAYSLTQLGIMLTDSTGSAFNSLALPTSLSINQLGDFLVRVFYINEAARAGGRFDANIVNFSLVQTPLPAALPLFATGLAMMGLLLWRRSRKVLP